MLYYVYMCSYIFLSLHINLINYEGDVRALLFSLYESATHIKTRGCLIVLVWAWYVIKQATACILPLKIVSSNRTHSNGQEESQENEEVIKQKSAIYFRFKKHNCQVSLAGTTSSQLSMCTSAIILSGQIHTAFLWSTPNHQYLKFNILLF